MTEGRIVASLPPPGPETLRQRATYLQYRTAWAAAAALPDSAARRLPSALGGAWWRGASAGQRDQVARNLTRVTGTPVDAHDDLVRDAYVSYARYWIDSFRLHRMDAERVVAASTGHGLELLDAVRDSGRGGILATGHLGSWDVGAFWTSQRRWRLVVVAEVLEPRRLFERFVRLREQAGLVVVPLVRGGDMLDRLEAHVRDGAIAALLADRDLTRKGPIVRFFGEPCRLPPGVAALARRTGRRVLTGAFFTRGDGFHAHVLEAIDVAGLGVYDGTQALAARLEELVRLHPEQWHVFVPNWLADREPDHAVVAAWRRGDDWQDMARREWEASEPSGRQP
jgi:KDO2-lipid IV(A) lauroyltransferase